MFYKYYFDFDGGYKRNNNTVSVYGGNSVQTSVVAYRYIVKLGPNRVRNSSVSWQMSPSIIPFAHVYYNGVCLGFLSTGRQVYIILYTII